MFDLNNFSVVSLTKGLPNMSISQYGISFNKTTIIKLGKPAKVKLMIDDTNKILAIVKPSEEDDIQTLANFLAENKKTISVRWNNADLLERICEMLEIDTLEKENYKVTGEFDKNLNAMFFDLKKIKK